MKIGINGRRLLFENPAGPEVYTYNIINALSKIDNKNDYIIYFDKTPSEDYFRELTSSNKKFRYRVIPKGLSWTHHGLFLELIKNPVDVYFTAVHTFPFLLGKRTKVVAMIHGLEYIYSEQYQNPFRKYLTSLPVKLTAQKSSSIIVPSVFTKEAILSKNWSIPQSKITVISEGVSKKYHAYSENEVQEVLEKYSLENKRYFIFVSTIEPRKNIPVLVQAFSSFLQESSEQYSLVLCGKKGWLYEESLEAPKKYGVDKNVHFLGRVSDEDLPKLYSGALAFISTSLEEGFGLPLLEAMSSETPCIVSDIPSFRDIGQDTVYFMEPKSVPAIVSKMDYVVDSENATSVEEKIRLAKMRSQNYSWESTAIETLKVFDKSMLE